MPATWSDRVAALPDLGLAAFALATWIEPRNVGSDAVRFVVGTFLIEFIVIHSAVFMGVAAFRQIPRRARIVSLTALIVMYSMVAGAVAAQLHQWWLSELADRVAVLDGVVRVRFGDDPDVMAGWHAAKRVPGVGQGGAKSTLSTTEEPKPGPSEGVVPPTSGAGGSVAPAA